MVRLSMRTTASTSRFWTISIGVRPEHGKLFILLETSDGCGFLAIGNALERLENETAGLGRSSKELGLPLRFPGRRLHTVPSTRSPLLTFWQNFLFGRNNRIDAGTIFNITNGDYFRWQFMWPSIAKPFHMEVAEPVSMPLSIYMAGKGSLWAE